MPGYRLNHRWQNTMQTFVTVLKQLGLYLIALLAAFCWGLPANGVSTTALRISWIGAIVLFLLAASLPRTRRLCLQISITTLLAFAATQLWWQSWMSGQGYNWPWLYTLVNLLGNQGDGMYALVEYQMFLLLFCLIGLFWIIAAIPTGADKGEDQPARG